MLLVRCGRLSSFLGSSEGSNLLPQCSELGAIALALFLLDPLQFTNHRSVGGSGRDLRCRHVRGERRVKSAIVRFDGIRTQVALQAEWAETYRLVATFA
eukprot:5577933-Pleurochrysis_carterae.AAC.3